MQSGSLCSIDSAGSLQDFLLALHELIASLPVLAVISINFNSDDDFWADDGVVPMVSYTPTRKPKVFPWAICLGVEDIESENMNRSLDFVVDLGATYVRVDFIWNFLENVKGQWDPGRKQQYHDLISACKQRGIGIIAVLGAGGTWPDWVKNKYDITKWGAKYENIRNDWIEFCNYVANNYGKDIHYYQILNEENHFGQERVKLDDECKVINDAHKAIEDGGGDTGFETIVNVHTSVPAWESWQSHMDMWLRGAKDSIDILAIDHYPGTYTWFTGAGDWKALDQLIEICKSSNKKGAIMETGFSTWGAENTPWCFPLAHAHTEDDQAAFINRAFPIIREKVHAHNSASENKIVLGSWFTLKGGTDYRAYIGLQALWLTRYIEPNFGILDDKLTKKLGYKDLKEQIKTFY